MIVAASLAYGLIGVLGAVVFWNLVRRYRWFYSRGGTTFTLVGIGGMTLFVVCAWPVFAVVTGLAAIGYTVKSAFDLDRRRQQTAAQRGA